jgi:hypothetical protein
MSQKLNKYSSRITGVKSQGASQAMLYGVGLTDTDMQKAQVGISSVWFEGNTCNMHLNQLSAKVKEGVDEAGLVGLRFNTIGVSDGISKYCGVIWRRKAQWEKLPAKKAFRLPGRQLSSIQRNRCWWPLKTIRLKKRYNKSAIQNSKSKIINPSQGP